jgi:hypothetical protein
VGTRFQERKPVSNCSAKLLQIRRASLEDRRSGRRNCTRSPMLIGDCARTVHESNVFIALGLASSEKQIPQIVENIGNQNREGNDWRGLRFFASRGSPVRSRSRPPFLSDCKRLTRIVSASISHFVFHRARTVQNRADLSHCAQSSGVPSR